MTRPIRERTCQVLMKTNKSMISFDQRRACIMQEESTRNFLHLSRPAYNAARTRRATAPPPSRRGRAPELSFIISPGQVGSTGIMQLFRCHNLKSWSIRPCHGRNQRRPGVTGREREWALISERSMPRLDAFSSPEVLGFPGKFQTAPKKTRRS